MKPVATVNTIRVYSDKEIASISNSRITFSDGSYCDVATGEVVSRGSGFITLRQPPAGETGGKVKTIGPKTFEATAVDLRNLAADVTVTVGDTVTVTVEGNESEVEKVRKSVSGDRLTISGGSSGGSGVNISMTSGRGNVTVVGGNVRASRIVTADSISISGGRVRTSGPSVVIDNAGGGENGLKVTVTVTVPKGTEIVAEDVEGNLVIGDTEGTVQVTTGCRNKATLGKVGNATLSSVGQSKITARDVNGSLMATSSGQSTVQVRGGQIAMLMASSTGQSKIKAKGTAQNANLNASGQSEIDVAHVVNRPMRNRSGQADIEVGNW